MGLCHWKKTAALAFLSILLISFSAGSYYADISITLAEDGSATIAGDTNHPGLVKYSTMEYTDYKNGRYTFNLTYKESFSSYIYEISFPKGAKINYLKTQKLARIIDDSGNILVIGTGSNQPFSLVAQYSLPEKRDNRIYYAGGAVLIAMLVSLMALYKKKKPSGLSYNPETLTDRQKQIIGILRKNRGSSTQAKIEKITGLPKSSLSRNIDSLSRRGIIKKEQKGMSNLITLITKEEK